MKTYKAKKSKLFVYLLLFFAILSGVGIYIMFSESKIVGLLVLLPVILLLWIYFDTGYKVDEKYFYYHSAFIRGRISIDEIVELYAGTTMWAGLKPAMSNGGIIIKYNKYDEIYIAPQDNDKFVNDLLTLNPKIKVKENINS
ncbi:MAG: PH domain-containing protein [Mesonia hippocampi]|uniref:PH domain-containing protein n=1 Tax=Mesonia hippocampi TaxID=1628250 RepID=UPI003F9AD9D0